MIRSRKKKSSSDAIRFPKKYRKCRWALSEIENAQEKMVLYKKETEYYVKLDDILFFETGINGIEAHTKNDIFQTKRKLYELEELLPGIFMRISKSADPEHKQSICDQPESYRFQSDRVQRYL